MALCPVMDDDGNVISTMQYAHCAREGLGGYDLAELEEAKRIVKMQAAAFIRGYEDAHRAPPLERSDHSQGG